MDLSTAPEGVNVPDDLRRAVAASLPPGAPVSILEAGCGSASQLDLGPNAVVTGIDISRRQLERNTALSARINGDLQTYPLGHDAFDVVVCWNVLEHLRRPDRALDNMVRALKPGGLLVLAVPNAYSLKGWLARATPQAFHVWVYRTVFGYRNAGADDRGPFETHFAWPVTPVALRSYAAEHHLAVTHWWWHEDYGQRMLRRRLRISDRLWRQAGRWARRLSRGRVDPDRTDYFVVLSKQAANQSSSTSSVHS